MEKNDRSLKAFAERLHLIRDREEKELQELMKNPDTYHVAQLLTDRLATAIQGLFNYKHVIDNYGKKHSIQELAEELEDSVREEFVKLTGREYVPTICRQLDFVRMIEGENRK